MPSLVNRAEQARSEELPEYPMTGPFGGIQSEMSPSQIADYGFADASNIVFRLGRAWAAPGYTALPLPSPAEPINGVRFFHNSVGNTIQSVITPTRLFKWDGTGQTWDQITGPAFAGAASRLFSFAVVGQKLCFSQGTDPVWLWDGIASTYAVSSPDAVAAFFMIELDTHLLVGKTYESGTLYAQRYRWTGAGDPTDWTSFNSGINDYLSDLGPIQGLMKLGQIGYGFHHDGIIQILPTGSGLEPFYFLALINQDSRGLLCPYSLAHYGEEIAVYVGQDNVYMFDGSNVYPIGDQPLQGRKRLGARSRILADIRNSDPNEVYGVITESVNGNVFNAYWLFIPNGSTWIYNFDEQNWSRVTWSKTPVTAGLFFKAGVPRIMDLIGTIAQQSWTPATLAATNQFYGLGIGFSDGNLGYVDFTNYTDQNWFIQSGKYIFQDRRHKHTTKKFRLVVFDQGPVTYTVQLVNESGVAQTQEVTLGTGSGDDLSYVFTFSITGLRLQWTVLGPPGAAASFVEFCPISDIGGEQRGGSADGN